MQNAIHCALVGMRVTRVGSEDEYLPTWAKVVTSWCPVQTHGTLSM